MGRARSRGWTGNGGECSGCYASAPTLEKLAMTSLSVFDPIGANVTTGDEGFLEKENLLNQLIARFWQVGIHKAQSIVEPRRSAEKIRQNGFIGPSLRGKEFVLGMEGGDQPDGFVSALCRGFILGIIVTRPGCMNARPGCVMEVGTTLGQHPKAKKLVGQGREGRAGHLVSILGTVNNGFGVGTGLVEVPGAKSAFGSYPSGL